MGIGHFACKYQGNGGTPCQYIDTTRTAIDCVTVLPLTVFIGRPFVKRFALCYRSVVLSVSPVCLSVCLSVTFVHCGQTVGRIKLKLSKQVGLGPGPIVLDGDPAPLPQRGTAPQFSAHISCGQMAAWIKMSLGMQLGLGPGDFVLDGDQSTKTPVFVRKHLNNRFAPYFLSSRKDLIKYPGTYLQCYFPLLTHMY